MLSLLLKRSENIMHGLVRKCVKLSPLSWIVSIFDLDPLVATNEWYSYWH